ncbi:MAG: hypothetical protein HUK14_01635 [Muribaculaceae bacterium]|nr:hypothetical protein [Muribaculaceae bacterium]
MKKILLGLAVACAVMTSCGSKEQAAANESANDFKAKIENCTNPDSLKIYVEKAVAYAQELQASGKLEEAKAYLNDIKGTVTEKVPALSGLIDTAVKAIDAVPGAATEAVEGAKDAAVDQANQAVDAAKEDINNKVDEQVNKATEQANKAVDDAKNKAADAVQGAADKIKAGFGK